MLTCISVDPVSQVVFWLRKALWAPSDVCDWKRHYCSVMERVSCAVLCAAGLWWRQVCVSGDGADERRRAAGPDPAAEVLLRARDLSCALHHHQDCGVSAFTGGQFACGHSGDVKYFLVWLLLKINVNLDHKNSHKGTFFEIDIYTSSECGINKLSIDVCLLW